MAPKTITIHDIAQAAGVSVATVNRALYNKPRVSAETRTRILSLAQSMGYRVNKAAQALSRGAITIGVVVLESIPEFHNDVLAGLDRGFQKLAPLNVRGDVRRVPFSRTAVMDGALREAEDLFARGCDGVVLMVNDDDRIRALVDRQRENGILTAALINDIRPSRRALSVRSDGVCGGRMAAELLHMLCPDRPAAVFASMETIDICRENLAGFQQEAARRGLQVCHVYYNKDDPLLAYQAAGHFVEHYPQAGGIYVCSANSAAVCRRLEETGLAGRYKIVATDLFSDVYSNMDKGLIHATLYQNPQRQGELAVTALYDMITGARPPDTDILVLPQIVLQSNMEAVLRDGV